MEANATFHTSFHSSRLLKHTNSWMREGKSARRVEKTRLFCNDYIAPFFGDLRSFETALLGSQVRGIRAVARRRCSAYSPSCLCVSPKVAATIKSNIVDADQTLSCVLDPSQSQLQIERPAHFPLLPHAVTSLEFPRTDP